jgi:hypothetical protein
MPDNTATETAVDTDVYIILQSSPDRKVAAIGRGSVAAKPFNTKKQAERFAQQLEARALKNDVDVTFLVLPLKGIGS